MSAEGGSARRRCGAVDLGLVRLVGAVVVEHLVRGGNASGADADAATDLLSARENEVLRLLALGMTDREIAAGLAISPRSVESQ